MTIKGIGRVSKKEVMSILTRDGRESVKAGEITEEQLAGMYKLEMVRKVSKIGNMPEAFNTSYDRVPEGINELSPESIASVVDALYDAYNDGKNGNR